MRRCAAATEAGGPARSAALVHRPLWIFLGLYYVAVAHVDDAVSELGGFGVVSDHQHRLTEFLVGLAQHLQNDVRVFGVEIACGFVR